MGAALRLGGFLTALVAVFGVSYLTGTQSQLLLGPIPTHATAWSGTAASSSGYSLATVHGSGGRDVEVILTVTGPDGEPVSSFQVVDGAELQVTAVRRDLTGYQHRPAQRTGTTWTTRLDLTPGPWRIVVELFPTALGRPLVLGTDLIAAGTYVPQPVPATTDSVAVDGYRVTRTGTLTTGEDSLVSFRITRAGRPVTDLEPTLGSVGHGVIFRPDDLAYLHLHPGARTDSTGPGLDFSGSVPSRGTYGLFVEFQTAGEPHVAHFTVTAPR